MCALNALLGAPKVHLVFFAEHVQTTTVDTKINFAHVSYVSGTDKERRENGLKGKVNAQVRALEVRLVFSHRTCPNHPG